MQHVNDVSDVSVIVGEVHSIIATVFGYYENPHSVDLEYGMKN